VEVAALRPLPCPTCGQRHDLGVWLDQPGRRWLHGRVVEAVCAGCGAASQLELANGTMAIGSVAPGPEGSFRPDLRLPQPGLDVEASPAGLLVTLGQRTWATPMHARR
jgi:hypothetical protein